MDDISTLQIRVLSSQVAEATSRLHALEKGARTAETATGGLSKSMAAGMKNVVAATSAFMAATGAVAALRAVVKTTAEFQVLNAQLATATGSAEGATTAFAAIKDFATQTPFDLKQATEAFISLVNRGLDPSERAMRAYGDTASAMGFTLTDMVLAVSNATTGEYENLKKFGIKAAKLGDEVSFTFRGVTETVKNNSKDIEQYFMALGEKNFTGGMDRHMQTLTGAFSNLGDAWEVMKNTIGEGGLGDAVEDAVRQATVAISSFTEYMESGEMALVMEAWGLHFQGYVDDVSSGLAFINGLFQDHTGEAATTGKSVTQHLSDGMKYAVVGIRAHSKSIGYVMFGLVDAAVQIGKAIYDTLVASFKALIEAAKVAGKAMANALNPFSGVSVADALSVGVADAAATIAKAGETSKASWEASLAKIGIDAEVVAGGIVDSWNDAGDTIEAGAAKMADAEAKRAAYDKDREARAKDRSDRLAQFKVGGGGGPNAERFGGKKGGGGGGKQSEFEQLKSQLDREETAIDESFQRRLDIIQSNTAAGSQIQMDLSLALVSQYEEQAQREIEMGKRSSDTMWEAFAEEERLITESYERRKAIIMSSTQTTEEEKQALLAKAKNTYIQQARKHNAEENTVYLSAASDFFGNLASMGNAFGKKGFKVAQAAAIAQATIKMYESATSAYASLAGTLYVGPALGAAAAAGAIAAGMANIAQIKSQQYTGAYAHGGMIPSGKVGMVGEAGPELVTGPAVVTSAATTADKLRNQKASNTIINIRNYTGQPVEARETTDAMDQKVLEFIIGKAEQRIADNITKGGNRVSRALEGTYAVGRGKR